MLKKILSKKIITGYSIAELSIVLMILSFLAMISIIVFKSTPNSTKMLFKKSYSIIENTVKELVNDSSLYPFDSQAFGFVNDVMVKIPGTDEYTNKNTKFVSLFTNKLNLVSPPEEKEDNWEFITTDGICWTIEGGVFTSCSSKSGKKPCKKITLDVNCNKQHIFEVFVQSDGYIYVENELEKEYLSSHSHT